MPDSRRTKGCTRARRSRVCLARAFLSDRRRGLLEACRWERDDRSWRPGQAFYAALRKPCELAHDSQVYRAYLRAEERLRGAGGRVRRVVLDYELKRHYQTLRAGAQSRTGPTVTAGRTAPLARSTPGLENTAYPTSASTSTSRTCASSTTTAVLANREDVEVTTHHNRGAHAAAGPLRLHAVSRSSCNVAPGPTRRLDDHAGDPRVSGGARRVLGSRNGKLGSSSTCCCMRACSSNASTVPVRRHHPRTEDDGLPRPAG